MRIGLITNLNGKGLELDATLLSGLLMDFGHETAYVQFDQPCDQKFDLTISLEVINENFNTLAPIKVWVPNLEWAKPEILVHARKFDRIWAKTRDAERVLRDKFPQVTYTGFLSRDRRLPSPARERRFLHVGGDSGLKNTNAVLAAWRQWRWWSGELNSPLTVISRSIQTEVTDTPGVEFLKEVGDEELQQLQNECMFHLQPSAYEGWGHAVRESQSVGAVLLTTRGGPMAELKAPFEVDPVSDRKVCMATAYTVSGREIREKVGRMVEQPSHMIAKYQVDARAGWERMERESRERIGEAVEDVSRPVRVYSTPESVTPSRVKPVLGILGNFRAEHSTENDLAWTLDDMGYSRLCFQEDEIATEHILKMCEDTNISLLIYVHTHGWVTPGQFGLDELWKRLEGNGTKTCSFHLDRYWGLNINDRREDGIGKHPFWHTQRVFTVDGGHDEDFRSRGVEHTWLPPGVAKRNCYLGNYDPALACDVGFVGATSYHPEYPFREQLISFLQETYGERFRIYQGYRGQSLADVYASGKVFVGDSCFGGVPRYWSDRVPETLGRGGFLLHPETGGLNIPGLVTFTPGDLMELKDKIDYYLDDKQMNFLEPMRMYLTRCASQWVKDHETYHNRMSFLLRSMGVQ